ncbi:Acyl-protein thioesterase 1 [Cytospora mali]|uniref:Acyl-protein thioesterase 1 n=1 Tax=Cytospora mali TaxID=578113 RepID=A0A194V5B9_CYTMA|nr:Acyl-protein thioesterase 1 [Valsa mali var. pyri (nom. inval.)]
MSPEPWNHIIDPQQGQPHTHTVIFLHGRGDNARDFIKSVQRTWFNSQNRNPINAFPTFRWVFPTAGLKPCERPGNPQCMSQWFDVWDHLNLKVREELQAPGLKESVERIRNVIAEEAARLGGRYDKVVLMGISQGGATSVHTLLNLGLPAGYQGPRRLGAFVGIACRMPFPGRSLGDTRAVLGLNSTYTRSDEIIRNTPVMLEHCKDDPTVRFENGKDLKQHLEGYGATVVWREYPRGGHWFKSPEGLDDLTAFLSQALLTKN